MVFRVDLPFHAYNGQRDVCLIQQLKQIIFGEEKRLFLHY